MKARRRWKTEIRPETDIFRFEILQSGTMEKRLKIEKFSIARLKMKHRRSKAYINRIMIILLAAVFILAVACGRGLGFFTNIEETPYNTEETNRIVVGVSQLGSESRWRTANTESIQAALTKQNGYFLIFNNARQKQENQIKAIRSFISQRVDYIVFAPVVETGWETVLQEAKEAGIPVILMDRRVDVADKSLYATCVGSDFITEGELAGQWLAEDLERRRAADDPVNIVVLKGTEGSSSQIGRTVGFGTVAVKHENWVILEQAFADFTSAKGKEVMESLLKKYKDIDVVVSQNDDMTFGAIEAIRESGRSTGVGGDITIISFDAARDALEMVQSGIINVDIECNPNQGEYISEVIRSLEEGREVEKKYYVEEHVYTMENVTEEILKQRNY